MDSQPIWLSTTVQGGVIQLLSMLTFLFHLNIGSDVVTQLVAGVFGLIGTVLVIYGRIKAVKPLSIGSVILK